MTNMSINTKSNTGLPPLEGRASNQGFLAEPSKRDGKMARFSFFQKPITNVNPHSTVTLEWVFNLITSDYYRTETEALRSLNDPALAREYKSQNLDYVTFSGTFSQRGAKFLIQHSGLICIDFDYLVDLPLVKNNLLNDPILETALLFKSPSGKGLKWVVPIDLSRGSHETFFNGIRTYLGFTYGIEVDSSGRDTCRACFLSYDPEAYINPKYIL